MLKVQRGNRPQSEYWRGVSGFSLLAIVLSASKQGGGPRIGAVIALPPGADFHYA